VKLLAPLPPTDRNVGVWTTPGPQGIDVYRPLRRSTRVLQALVLAVAAVGVLLGAVGLLMWRQIGGGIWPLFPATSSSLDWSALHLWATRLAALQVGLVVVASIATVLWTRRAYRNLAGLDVHAKRLAPGWATAGWFVPGANLIVPKAIVDYTWRASEPRAASDGEWRSPIPTVNHLWWICTLVALPIMALAFMELSALGTTPPSLLGDIHAARATLVLLAVAELLVLFAAGLFVRTLGSITERQALRAARLGPPAAMVTLADITSGRAAADRAEQERNAAALDDLDDDPGADEGDDDSWYSEPWPDDEPALARFGAHDDLSGKY